MTRRLLCNLCDLWTPHLAVIRGSWRFWECVRCAGEEHGGG